MNIKGKSVVLRAPELSDLEKLHQWSNDPEIWEMLGGWHFPYSLRSTEEWIKSREDANQSGHVFCIVAPGDRLIGTANLVNIDWKNKNAFHGIMLGDADARGTGFAADAVMALMRYAFDELGLNRLDSDIIEYNGRSIKFYTEKCGWEIEGRKRNWYFRKGRFFDKIIIGVTKDNYTAFVSKNGYWQAR